MGRRADHRARPRAADRHRGPPPHAVRRPVGRGRRASRRRPPRGVRAGLPPTPGRGVLRAAAGFGAPRPATRRRSERGAAPAVARPPRAERGCGRLRRLHLCAQPRGLAGRRFAVADLLPALRRRLAGPIRGVLELHQSQRGRSTPPRPDRPTRRGARGSPRHLPGPALGGVVRGRPAPLRTCRGAAPACRRSTGRG